MGKLVGWAASLLGFSNRETPRPATGHVWRELPSGRTFLLNVPEAYDHSTAHPLIVSFHGGELPIESLKLTWKREATRQSKSGSPSFPHRV